MLLQLYSAKLHHLKTYYKRKISAPPAPSDLLHHNLHFNMIPFHLKVKRITGLLDSFGGRVLVTKWMISYLLSTYAVPRTLYVLSAYNPPELYDIDVVPPCLHSEMKKLRVTPEQCSWVQGGLTPKTKLGSCAPVSSR